MPPMPDVTAEGALLQVRCTSERDERQAVSGECPRGQDVITTSGENAGSREGHWLGG